MKTTIKQIEQGFNPLFLETETGKNLEINHFVFYDYLTGKEVVNNEGSIYEFYENIRWFNNSGSNNEFPILIFDFSIIKKKDHNLTRNYAYYVNYKSKYSFDKNKIVVFIPVQILTNYKTEKDVFQFETETEKKYFDMFFFDVKAVKREYRINDLKEIQYYNGELKTHTLKFHGYYKNVKTDLGKKIDLIKEVLDKNNININSSDIENIMKHFEITIKK